MQGEGNKFHVDLPKVTVAFFAAVAFGVFGVAGSVEAMFICRDSSGSVSYTNVRNSPNCTPIHLKKIIREIRQIARRYRVEPSLIKAIIHTESGFNPRAVSSKGARGLMQLMPDTAKDLGIRNSFNPEENIDGGTRYLRQILNDFNGDLTLSLAAYNAGPGTVRRSGGMPAIEETRQYVAKVLKRYKVYKNLM
ncbi:MAG: lytic transglycosylase [Deltaproteobacteria bacterium]|nr:MAG: lytic transglycosylase [Deltaproteobacteria bacterium]